ncbi:MAG TPA: class I SAM-dependent methyltransferase [Alphaproteobacteria bacterium]
MATVAIGPETYSAWRSTELGARTERLEQDLILRLAGDVADQRVLDAGCGDGLLAVALAARGARVTGLDADAGMLAAGAARAEVAGAMIRPVRGAIERLPFADASFDMVAAVTVLCFIRDPSRVLAEFRRVLVPGGSLVIGELNRWSVWALRRRVRGWLGAPLWRQAHFTDARRLRRLLAGAGFTVEALEGCVFYPPSAWLARTTARAESRLGRLTTFGAAFLAARAIAPPP